MNPILYNVFNREKLVGIVGFDEKGEINKKENCSQEIENIVSVLLTEGIDMNQCISGKDNKNTYHNLVKEKIMPNHHLFSLAFRDNLTSQGYRVIEIRTDIDEKINFLIGLGKASADTVNLCNNLADMSYLEKTYILEKLKRAVAKELNH